MDTAIALFISALLKTPASANEGYARPSSQDKEGRK